MVIEYNRLLLPHRHQVVFSLGEARNKAASRALSVREENQGKPPLLNWTVRKGTKTWVVRVQASTLRHCLH
jgi:hypothetical protein